MFAQSADSVKVHRVRCGPYDNNAYVVVCSETSESVIIDAPSEPEKVLDLARGTHVKAILITHNHFDHILGLKEIREATGAGVGIHKLDAHALSSPPEMYLKDGDEIRAGTVAIRVIHTPGHTPGSVCLLAGRYLFTGDTLFPGGPGKTSSPENLQELIKSVTTRLYPLPGESLVYPGHGPGTDLETSKEEYRAFAARDHRPDLCGDVLWLSS